MNKRPSLLVFAGPNGSGKSTITQLFNTIGDYTNADDIVRSSNIDNLEAAKLVEQVRNNNIYKGIDFTFETVLSSERYVDLIKRAHNSGYFVKVVFVLTSDSNINVSRVNIRFMNGGHGVPEDKIKSRYIKSINNIHEIIDCCDIMHIYDNTEKAIRIFRKHKDEQYRIFENKYWSRRDIERLINGTYDSNHVKCNIELSCELPDIG